MYSLTRTNVYAGLASEYLITDEDPEGEMGLLMSGVVPGMKPPVTLGASYPIGIPLVIQDKTFWDGQMGPGAQDPNYGKVPPAGAAEGSLWYPHVYEGGIDPDDLPSMALTDLPGTSTLRWGATPIGNATGVDPGQFPPNSTVPEFFSDINLVNGAPYPTVTVPPRRLRFRFLNASQARFYNLQIYVQDNTPDGITYASTGELDNNGNTTVAPTNRPGPAFIQIGNEGGFLPAPMVFSLDSTVWPSGSGARNLNSNRIIGYKSTSSPGITSSPGVTTTGAHRKADQSIKAAVEGDTLLLNAALGDPTIGNVDRYNLLMAPAERADVIVDFRDFIGRKLILYNDAPAPFPGGDIRNDYYVGGPDLTSIGGAPPTPAATYGSLGVGPDTRVLMQFVVATTGGVHEMSFADTVAALQKRLPTVFAATQPDPNALGNPTVQGKSLGEDTGDGFGRLRQMLGDGSGNLIPLVATPIDIAMEDEVQRWMIFNTTADTHPMHIHLVNFKVVGRQQWAFNPDGTFQVPLTPIGPIRPPDPNERGWKETIRISPGEVTILDMQFTLPKATATNPAPPNSPRLASYMPPIRGAEYVWHCHILEHEEHDMMHALVIIPKSS